MGQGGQKCSPPYNKRSSTIVRDGILFILGPSEYRPCKVDAMEAPESVLWFRNFNEVNLFMNESNEG